MAIFTTKYKIDSLALVDKFVTDSQESDPDAVISWIETHRKALIVEDVMEEDFWRKIVLAKLTEEQVEMAWNGVIKNGTFGNSVFKYLVNEIIYQYWCEDIVDLQHEVQEILARQDKDSDTRFEDDVAERTRDMQEEFQR